jgi:L-arabinokinase
LDQDYEAFVSRLESRLPSLAPARREFWIAPARGSLDVMGGIAEYSGGLTLSTPTDNAAIVAAVPRDDQRVHVVLTEAVDDPSHTNGHATEWGLSLSSFYGAAGAIAEPHLVRQRVTNDCRIKSATLAVAHAMLEAKLAPHLAGGFSLVVEMAAGGSVDCRRIAAIQAATATVLARALSIDVDECGLARVCRRAQTTALGCMWGISTHAAPLLAVPGALLPIHCRPFEVDDPITIPDGVVIIGVDCGTRHKQADEKYIQARAAAFIGRDIIKCMMERAGDGPAWSGYLADISVESYIEHYRDRLPTKLDGATFLERFRPPANEDWRIEPDVVYKVRSRTEHHVYEGHRTRQFAAFMRAAGKDDVRQTLTAAGDVMFASHWSYGQRCGLGSIETDLLVNLLRAEGLENGIYGARVSGLGAGGTVVVLMEDAPRAHDALRRALDAYEKRGGRSAVIQRMLAEGPAGIVVEHCA